MFCQMYTVLITERKMLLVDKYHFTFLLHFIYVFFFVIQIVEDIFQILNAYLTW